MFPQAHLEAARQFLSVSEDFGTAEAPLIKSEMLWCASAHCIKAAANQYNLTNTSHDDLFRVVQRLARNLSEPALRQSFNIASRLHKNMYEGRLNARDLESYAVTIHRFVNRVTVILAAYPQLPGQRTPRG